MAKRSVPEPLRILRTKAEEVLEKSPERILVVPTKDGQKLLHELSVYQVELEMQNEELRRAQREIEASRSRYVDLYDYAPVGYLTFDRKGLVSELNLPAAGLIGIERNRVLNKPFAPFIHPDSQDAFHLHRRTVLSTGRKDTCELVLKRKGGGLFNARLESIGVQVNGSPAIRSVLTDISEHKRMEEELERHRKAELARFASFPELNPNPVVETDLAGNIHYLNPAAEKLLPDLRSAGPSHPWIADLEPIVERFTEGAPFVLREVRLGESWYEQRVYYFAETGRIRSFASDITERKRAEGTLRQARDDLELRVQERTEELNEAYERLKEETTERERAETQLRQAQKLEALGTLAGGIAHDFNNILGAIIGFTELIQDHLPEESPESRHIKKVLDAGMRARDLIKQMLTFSRRSEGERRPLRLGSVVKETAKLLRASIPTTIGVRAFVKSKSGVILGDPGEIQQVLMNLATNAAHAMRENGGVLDIELSDLTVDRSKGNPDGIEPGPYMLLVVRDTGSGIPPEVMEKIFDPFFTTKKRGEGTGLGLSVVLGIVKQSHGYITAESVVGKGSTFTVYFPKVEDNPIAEAEADREVIPVGHERILLVDDEEALVEMGEELLAELGYEVVCRTSSREALALFRLEPARFDLVLTDQTMPDMTGMEMAREMLVVRPGLPVILATGFSHMVDADAAGAAGIKGFVMKPLTKREIAETVRKVLDACEQERL